MDAIIFTEGTPTEKDQGVLDTFTDSIKLAALEKEIDKLAKFLMEKYPEEITGGSAVDVAIKILDYPKKSI